MGIHIKVNIIANVLVIYIAMTFICLGISSMMKTAEKASLLSIYLVGFQLPLSGAVLALPDTVGMITRPFISAYWAWSGNLEALKTSEYAQAINLVTEGTSLHGVGICIAVLSIHVFVGLTAAYFGSKRHAWD